MRKTALAALSVPVSAALLLATPAFGQAREMGEGLLEDLEGYAKENPLPTLAVTLGVGLVLGLLMFGGRRR